MNEEPKRDWEKTWIHFFCGAIVGAGFGLYLWSDFSGAFWPRGFCFVAGGALIIGFVAGIFLDSFWEKLLEWFRHH